MHRKARTVPLALLLAGSVILAQAPTFARAQQRTAGPKSAAANQFADRGQAAAGDVPTEGDQAVQPQLSPQMAAVRDAVRAALARLANHPFNTRDNTPAQVMELCLAFGCDAKIGYGGSSGKKVNALGVLCWNYPCAGYRLLRESEGRALGRVGYGLQTRPSQFLAVLAQARVPIDYQIRVSDFQGTVADLVEFEKLNCRSGDDLSHTLIGLAHYLEDDQSWENDLEEEWSVERLVREEAARSASTSDPDVTDRLMGLSYAVDRRKQRGEPLDGVFLQAAEHVNKFHDYALSVQNPDGTWHPSFFAYRGTSREASGALRSTGHVLEWLVFSLPEERLEDPRVVRSVAYVAKLLGSKGARWSATSMSDPDFAALMRAVHALSMYDRRVFQAAAPERAPAERDDDLAYRNTPE